MSAIDPLSNALGSQATDGTGDKKSTAQLGQNEFLKLMLAQLKNQDPFKPTDPTQFLSQLAQFSAVTGIQNMQTSLTDLAGSLRSAQVLSGTNLVGRNVLAETTTANIAAGGSVYGAADVPAGASSVQINIRDSAGVLVRRMPMSTQTGIDAFTWDGRTDTGAEAPAGQYKFEIVANIGGQGQSLNPQLASRVESVTIDPNSSELTLNTTNGPVALSDVRQVM
jgi:flagellar basal-body rod modification protein FlgD